MKNLSTNQRTRWLDDIDAELPFLIIASCFTVCTAIAVYLYAATA